MSHIVPQPNGVTGRVRTGYESVIPHLVSDVFCVSAKDDGVVSSIDDNLKLVTISYKNGETKVFKYGNILGNASGSYVNHDIVLSDNIKLGMKFKRGDVLAYNSGFFNRNKYTKQVTFNHGVYANIALLESDTTIEDANLMTAEFVKKLSFNTSKIRSIKIDTMMTIENYKFIGDEVSFADSIMRLSYVDVEQITVKDKKDNDEDVESLLEDLQSINTKAKSNGTITDVRVYYTAEKSEFHPSVVNFINRVERKYKATEQYVKKADNGYAFTMPRQLAPGTRVGKKALEENSLLIEYVISSQTAHGIGDKGVIGTCLKTITSSVTDDNIYTEDGSPVDGLFGGKSVFNRIVVGDIKIGVSEKILEKFEDDLREKFGHSKK